MRQHRSEVPSGPPCTAVQPKASFTVQLDDRHVVGCGIYRAQVVAAA